MHDPFVGGAWRGSTDESRQSQRQDQEQRTGVSAPQGLGQQITWRGWSAGLGTPENGNLVHTGGDASEIKRGNPPCHLPKNHKAGLVGPAVLLWNWFVRSWFDRRPRMSKS
jgi:hypothetical protein